MIYPDNKEVAINGETLTLAQFESVCFGAPVKLAESVLPRINESREVVDELLVRCSRASTVVPLALSAVQ